MSLERLLICLDKVSSSFQLRIKFWTLSRGQNIFAAREKLKLKTL